MAPAIGASGTFFFTWREMKLTRWPFRPIRSPGASRTIVSNGNFSRTAATVSPKFSSTNRTRGVESVSWLSSSREV